MKRLSLVIVAILMTLFLVSCNNKEIDNCFSDLRSGLEEHWTMSQDYESIEDMKNKELKDIEIELKYMKKYKNKEFEDKEFKSLIKKYITALESEKKGYEKYYYNNEMFNKFYYEKGSYVRNECLSKFVEDYNFSVDDKYSKKLKTTIDDIKKYKRISIGEMINVSNKYGEVSIAIDGFEIDQASMNLIKEGYGFEDLEKNQEIGILKYILKNKSYYDEYNENFVTVDSFIQIYDKNNFAIEASSTAGDYKGYSPAAGAFAEVPKGQKKKLATEYIIDNDNDKLFIKIGEYYSLMVDIE